MFVKVLFVTYLKVLRHVMACDVYYIYISQYLQTLYQLFIVNVFCLSFVLMNMSFILMFVPHYFDCLCDTFLKAILTSMHWHLHISINSKVLFFIYENFIEKLKQKHMAMTFLVVKYLAPVSI